MSLVMTSGPGLEPITLAEAKAHLRIDSTADDALIQSLIVTSRLHIEAALGLALITQSWSWFLDRWPKALRVALPLRPVQAVTSVRHWRVDATSETLNPALFFLDGHAMPARLAWLGTAPPAEPERRVNGIEIAFTSGFGATAESVPSTIRHALLLLVAHWYENREPVEIGSGVNAVPPMVAELLAPHRRRRL